MAVAANDTFKHFRIRDHTPSSLQGTILERSCRGLLGLLLESLSCRHRNWCCGCGTEPQPPLVPFQSLLSDILYKHKSCPILMKLSGDYDWSVPQGQAAILILCNVKMQKQRSCDNNDQHNEHDKMPGISLCLLFVF